MKIRIAQLCTQTHKIESIMNFVAEWFCFEEMKVLQGISVSTSVWARDCIKQSSLGFSVGCVLWRILKLTCAILGLWNEGPEET